MPTVTHLGVKFDVYAVGLLKDIRVLQRDRNWRKFKRSLGRVYVKASRGEWNDVQNYFNGYLAEPTNLSEFVSCGTGWTWNRAVRRFFRDNTIRFKSDDTGAARDN